MHQKTCAFAFRLYPYTISKRTLLRFLYVDVQDKSVIVNLRSVSSISEETYVSRVSSEQQANSTKHLLFVN